MCVVADVVVCFSLGLFKIFATQLLVMSWGQPFFSVQFWRGSHFESDSGSGSGSGSGSDSDSGLEPVC